MHATVSTHVLLPLLALLPMTTGCPSNDPGDGADAGASAARPSYEDCRQLAVITCNNAYACDEQGAETRANLAEWFGATDGPSCETSLGQFYVAICSSAVHSIDLGRSVHDSVAMSSCLDAMNSASCSEFFQAAGTEELPLDGMCARFPFMEGIQDVQAPCAGTFECAGDAICYGAVDGVDGVCRTDLIGDTCVSDDDCALEELYCDQPGNDYWVTETVEGTCAERGDVGDECDDFGACKGDLHCDNTNGFDPDLGVRLPGNCVELKGPGEVCDEGSDCVSGMCSDTLTSDGTCS